MVTISQRFVGTSFENMMNILKNKFWLFDRFSPVQWMTLEQQFLTSVCPSLRELNVIQNANRNGKLCFQTHIFA